MAERFTLDAEQAEAAARMVAEPTRAALNASQYGTGKTIVTVEVAQAVAPNGVKLIVAPLHTKYSWRTTIQRQYPGADVRFINSNTKAGKQALAALEVADPAWYIIGRELFHHPNTANKIIKISPKIDFLAYDECQRWANHKSQSFTMIKKVKPKYRMALSATPGANKFSGLFAITQWLWPNLEGHRSFWKWAYQWALVSEDYFAGTLVDGEANPGAFVASLPCYVRLEKDFGDPIHMTVEVELSRSERRVYNQIEESMIAFLEDNPLVIKLPITKRMRLRQASLGDISYDPELDMVYYAEGMNSTKYDALVGMMKDHDEPMVIFTDSEKYASVVANKLVADGYRAKAWTGKVSEKARHQLLDDFKAGTVDYIVATIQSIGEGVDGLQDRARVMVWLNRSDNMMFNEQAFRRLYRRGQTRTVISIDLVALDTYDSGQLSTLIQRAIDMNRSLKHD